MHKTIEECRLDLVAHSVLADYISLDDPTIDLVVSCPSDINGWSLDYFPCSAARVSFGKEDKTGDDPNKDRKLMQYLADHEHMTPFEHQSATFLVEVPLFIRSQIHRHRTFAYNEISRRYTDEDLAMWVPTTFRKQSDSNKQASTDEEVFEIPAKMGRDYDDPLGQRAIPLDKWFKNYCTAALFAYEEMVKAGVCREQARAILPQALLTKFYMTGNLRNWAHFVRLRKDAHAQREVQVVANRIDDALTKLWPTAWGVLNDKESQET